MNYDRTCDGRPLLGTVRQFLRLAAPLGLLSATLLAACGGSDDDRGGEGSPTDPDDQPPIVPLPTDESLGAELGGTPDGAPRPDATIRQAVVAGEAVCALDSLGDVFCWAAAGPFWEEREASITWPATPTKVRLAPPLTLLVVPTARDRGDGQSETVGNAVCGVDAENLTWCWGAHPENPAHERVSMVAAKQVSLAGDVQTPAVPPAILSTLDARAGLATIDERSCGLRPDGTLVCWPGVFSSDAEEFGTLPAGSRLAGACALTPDGAVGCYLPLPDGPTCALGLTSLQGTGRRVCGSRDDGTWACVGRPVGSGVVTIPGLVDYAMDACP